MIRSEPVMLVVCSLVILLRDGVNEATNTIKEPPGGLEVLYTCFKILI